ncbi:T9SS type A sorting domain-containing protein [Flavobacterium sharifuzzamanii]|uniref:T9SS type A sorting domain-containing protein n=1 Tax=Flavobacterium sharifuzzamanii TaxID=2211133 RepID=UPI000DAC187F|nr:T9SS type A sorting domain-containing protein [Flavobacterium sharifuzzamanii]KAF2082450.1 T9SS type A sorting domain-containing protein [Flavobacterium sharifuzzamanii]
MKNFTFFIVFLFFAAFKANSQATSSGSTLTVTNVAGTVIYYEHNINLAGGYINSSGPGAPLNTPIRIKISSAGTSVNPYFTTGELNGECDSYLAGSMNSTSTAFTTTLNNCCNSIAEGFANGLRFEIPIKCATPVQGSCITYNFSSVCNLYCASFYMQTTNAICRTKNYTAQIGFTDGTSTTITVNFNANNTVFCFVKPISGILSSSFAGCNACNTEPSPERIAATADETESDSKYKIVVSPNPTTSVVNFTGKNLEKYVFSLFDSEGRVLIKDAKITSEINVGKFIKGIYVYVITDQNGFRQEGKIIKD